MRLKTRANLKPLSGSSGFTLLELVLATLISTLVVGILSVSLSFSLRVWERQQNQKSSNIPRVLELMKWQLATFDPVPINYEEESRPLFIGNRYSLTFVTDYSVKALSKGVPVIARYVYIPEEKTLHYAELPLDPYHPEPIEEFIQLKPGSRDSQPHFYTVKMDDFSIDYVTEEGEGFTEIWGEEEVLPRAVVVKCHSEEDSFSATHSITPGFLFPKMGESEMDGLLGPNELDDEGDLLE